MDSDYYTETDEDDDDDDVKHEQDEAAHATAAATAFNDHMGTVTAADRPLQLLLKHIGCKWLLKAHQFVGVRAVAGVPDGWPTAFDAEGKPDSLPPLPAQRGIAEGDDMGLGKTIMALAGGVAVRAYIEALRGRPSKPALVIAPNAAVAAQWRTEALGMMDEREIWSHSGQAFGQALHKRFSRLADEDEATRPRLAIVTRSQLQTEMSHVFRSQREAGGYKPSPLAPHLLQKTVLALQQKYLHANPSAGAKKAGGKAKEKAGAEDEGNEDRLYDRSQHKMGDDSTPSGGVLAIWREAQKRFTPSEHLFSIVLIDEVHELKNPHTLATMLAVAAGLHAPRVISISGTGYNNHLQDMATLHLLIDPSWQYADLHFWKDLMEPPEKVIERHAVEAHRARQEGRAAQPSMALAQIKAKQAADKAVWERDVLVRRTKASCGIELPKKTHVVHELQYAPLELGMSVTLTLSLSAPVRQGHKVRVALMQAAPGGEGGGTEVQLGTLTAGEDAQPIRREIGLLGDEHSLLFEVLDAHGVQVHVQSTSVARISKDAFQLMERELMALAMEAAKQSAAASASAATVAAAKEAKQAKERVLDAAAKTFALLPADPQHGGRGVTVSAAVSCDVLPHSYLQHEKEFLKILPLYDDARKKATARGGTFAHRAATKKKEKQLFQVLMAKITNMQMALSHPVLVGKGREASVLFGSRGQQPKAKFCALCKPEARDVSADKTDADLDPNKDKDTDDEDDGKEGVGRREEQRFDTDGKPYTRQEFVDEYGDEWRPRWRAAPKEADGEAAEEDGGGGEDKSEEPFVMLPPSCCAKARGSFGHFAHLSCYHELCQAAEEDPMDDKAEGGADDDDAAPPSCPRCRHLLSGLVVQPGAAFDESRLVSSETPLWDDTTPSGGYHVTPKLAKLLELTRGVPAADKLLVFSKFLGCLDLASNLLEATQYRCERFDGEVKDKTRALDRARAPEVKVLLSTIRSGGVGLNLQEFNHVIFESRDLNPQKHKQAEDRVHRLGQAKDVTVVYLDAKDTFDEAVRELMNKKLDNAQAILDGKLLPKEHLPTYKDVVGQMGAVLRKVIARRAGQAEDMLLPLKRPSSAAADATAVGGRVGRGGKMKVEHGRELAQEWKKWQGAPSPHPLANAPSVQPSPRPSSAAAKAAAAAVARARANPSASSAAAAAANPSASSTAAVNSLPPHRRVTRRLKEKGIDKDRFSRSEIDATIAAENGNVDRAVAQLMAAAAVAAKGGSAGGGSSATAVVVSSSDTEED